MFSHVELLSKIERQNVVVIKKCNLVANNRRVVARLMKDAQKLRELKYKLEDQCKKHKELNELRLDQTTFSTNSKGVN